VIDRSGARFGEYEDVSRVEKYEMADSDYDKQPGDASPRPGDVPSPAVALVAASLSPPWHHRPA